MRRSGPLEVGDAEQGHEPDGRPRERVGPALLPVAVGWNPGQKP